MDGILNRGEVAAAANVNIETLRYYERRGVIPPPVRSESNYRKYPANMVSLIRFIKHAQDLGFTLDEIKDLLSLRASRGARAAQVRAKQLKKSAISTKRSRLCRTCARLSRVWSKSAPDKGPHRAARFCTPLNEVLSATVSGPALGGGIRYETTKRCRRPAGPRRESRPGSLA